MFQILYKYLILYKKAAIPGIGLFSIERKPAQFDFNNQEFLSPIGKIAFNPVSTKSDPKWLSFLSKEQQMDDVQARESVDRFSEHLQNQLRIGNSIELPGFGVLSRDEANVLHFQSTNALTTFLTNVAVNTREADFEMLPPVTAENDKQDEAVAEVVSEEVAIGNNSAYWWIAAVILAAIAIAAIVFYYYQNGSFR